MLFGIRVKPREPRRVNEYRHLKCTNLFEVSLTFTFEHRLSVQLGLIRSCPPHQSPILVEEGFRGGEEAKPGVLT